MEKKLEKNSQKEKSSPFQKLFCFKQAITKYTISETVILSNDKTEKLYTLVQEIFKVKTNIQRPNGKTLWIGTNK